EPGSFVPVAQALRRGPVRLHKQPDWSQRSYDFDQDPLWQTHMQPQAFDALAWYQCDHLGTPMELTDHNGEMAWAGQYKAWGEVREERSAWARQVGLSNPLRFQGQYHDRETGLHYNRYRYYDPGIGRFVGQDPISYAGGLNLYVYAPSPVNWTDPFGLAKHNPNSQHCIDLRNKIANKKIAIEKRWKELELDEKRLPEYIGPGESLHETRRGHRTLINMSDISLRKSEEIYEGECGGREDSVSSKCSCSKVK
ncbi:RHS repeat domain-containing protein, partial [Pseudomonas palmensis]